MSKVTELSYKTAFSLLTVTSQLDICFLVFRLLTIYSFLQMWHYCTNTGFLRQCCIHYMCTLEENCAIKSSLTILL